MNVVFRRLVWLILLLPGLYLLVIWNRLPATVPMHFDASGKATGYGSKNDLAVINAVVTGVGIVIYLLLLNLYKIDPRKSAALNKERLQRMAFMIVVFITVILLFINYDTFHGSMVYTTKLMIAAVCLLIAFFGNNFYNIKPNYFAGYRLPWTLESEDNWRKTHHLAGRLWFFGGLLLSIWLCVCLINGRSSFV